MVHQALVDISPEQLASEADWFPFRLDAATGSISFVKKSRDTLSCAPFLDERLLTGDESFASAPVSAIRELMSSASVPRTAYIFHTAFCASTLLASVLDVNGRALALKEPGILMDTANVRRNLDGSSASQQRFREIAHLVMQLLARRFSDSEIILIKPTNAANNLLQPALPGEANVLLLYSDLKSFLVSVIKKGEACRSFIRQLFNIFLYDREDIQGWSERDRLRLTDLQVAALVWSIQIDHFERIANTAGDKMLATLHVDDFLDKPENALQRAQELLGLQLADKVEEIAASPRFHRHSKFLDQDYDSSARESERREIEKQYSEEIALSLAWAEKLRNGRIPERLPRDLMAGAQSC